MEVLCDGGNYVVKMFTALEYHMVTMLYLLCCVFKEVHFIKPGKFKSVLLIRGFNEHSLILHWPKHR